MIQMRLENRNISEEEKRELRWLGVAQTLVRFMTFLVIISLSDITQ